MEVLEEEVACEEDWGAGVGWAGAGVSETERETGTELAGI